MDLGQFILNVVANIVGDAIFAVVLTLGAVGASAYVWRRQVRRFFGHRAGGAPIRIRLSNLYVLRTRATVHVTTGFRGPAMSELEYRYALALAREIQTKPLVRALAARFEDLSGQWIDPMVCEIGLSPSYARDPDDEADVDLAADHELAARLRQDLGGGTFVLVGASIYNLLTHYVTASAESRFRFTLGLDRHGVQRRAIEVRQFHADGRAHTFPREMGTDDGRCTDHFVLQKLVRDGSTIFICAGTCPSGTVAALRLLADWRALWRRYGDRGFAALYEFTTHDTEGEPEWDSVQERWSSAD